MASATYDVFRQAILQRKQVVCTYGGYPRELCPHVAGLKSGREKVLSYQFGGSSSTGLPPGGEWRCMFIADVSNAQLRDGPWHTGAGHSRPQTCVDDIDVEIPY